MFPAAFVSHFGKRSESPRIVTQKEHFECRSRKLFGHLSGNFQVVLPRKGTQDEHFGRRSRKLVDRLPGDFPVDPSESPEEDTQKEHFGWRSRYLFGHPSGTGNFSGDPSESPEKVVQKEHVNGDSGNFSVIFRVSFPVTLSRVRKKFTQKKHFKWFSPKLFSRLSGKFSGDPFVSPKRVTQKEHFPWFFRKLFGHLRATPSLGE